MDRRLDGAIVSGLVLGLTAHQVFRKHEPTISVFFYSLFTLDAAVAALHVALYNSAAAAVEDIPFVLLLTTVFNLVYLATLSTSIVLYRTLFHPLRNYPGPLLFKITKWAWFFGFRGGRYHRFVFAMHQKYGDVVRLGPNDLVFFDANDAAIVNGPYSKMAKGSNADGSPFAKAKSVTFVKDRQEHRLRRRIWDRGFTTASLVEYEPRLGGLLKSLSDQFASRDGQEIDFADWTSFFAFDAMGDLGFGKDFQMVEKGTTHLYRDYVKKSFKLRSMWMTMSWCKNIVNYLPMEASLVAQSQAFVRFGNERFQERKSKGTSRPDVFSHLLAQDEQSGGRLTEDELREDAKAVILAGSDTTAYALTMILFCLMENPAAYEAMQKEIDELNANGPFKGTALGPEQIPFTVGVINEGLRLFPPAPEPTQRTNGDTPMTINGKYIPPRTSCYMCPYALHHDERYFSRPEEFLPERWIDEKRPRDFNHEAKAWVPFGSGLYNCAGRTLAMLEMRQFLATICYRFSFGKGPSYDKDEFLDSLTSNGSMECGSLPLLVSRRNVDTN